MTPNPPLDKLGTPTVLVVGDLMLDEYVWGEVSRVSPEAPVPVLAEQFREHKAGGAGSVVENLVELGARVLPCGLVGDDEAGRSLLDSFGRYGLDVDGIVVSKRRPTTRKTRMMAYVQQAHRAQQQILRLDSEKLEPLDDEERDAFLSGLERAFDQNPRIVLASDYEKGLLTPEVIARLVELASERDIPVLVDPGRSVDYARYRGVTLICPNRFEAQQATGVVLDQPERYEKAGKQLVADLELRYAILTLDREGILLVDREGRCQMFPTRVRTVTDVAGAGDMVHTLLGLALGSEWSIDEAIALANLGAGVEVSKVGVSPVERWELYQALAEESSASKVRRLEDLAQILDRSRAAGKCAVFTNGCFDLVHAGHVTLLEKAREFGDVLIVGVNSDDSVRRLKGDGRPLNSAENRGRTLSALTAVDHVVFFDEDTPEELIARLRPDVLVKGSDYEQRPVVGREMVEQSGGRVELIPLQPEVSTTHLLDKIRRHP